MNFLKKNYKFIIMLLAVFCFGWFLPNPKIEMPNNTEKKMLTQSKIYLNRINDYFKDNKIDIELDVNKLEKIKEGTAAGYKFTQYGMLFNDDADFISLIYNNDTNKILAIFVNEAHKINSKSYAKETFIPLVLAIDDNLTSEEEDNILEKINNDEKYYSNNNVTFYVYKNDVSQNEEYNDIYDYEITYELDLFKYSGDDLNEETNTD